MTTPPLECAKYYAEAGFQVVALDLKTASRLAACKPMNDLALIEEVWAQHPLARIGIDYEASGLVALSAVSAEGLSALSALQQQHEQLPSSPRLSTRHGELRLFRARENAAYPDEICPGVKLQRRGICIAHEPKTLVGSWSRMIKHRDQIPEAPAWLETGRPRSEPESTCADAGPGYTGSQDPSMLGPPLEEIENNDLAKPPCEKIVAVAVSELEAAATPPSPAIAVIDLSTAEPRTDSQPDLADVPIVCANSVPMRPVKWLWPGHITEGRLTLLIGVHGAGKTSVAASVAAIVSNGSAWPDGAASSPAGNVLVFNVSDDREERLHPKFVACGANVDRIFYAQTAQDRTASTTPLGQDDLAELRRAVQKIGGIRLLIVDPLPTVLYGSDDKRSDMPRGLDALIAFAEENHCGLLGVCDFVRGSNKALGQDRLAMPKSAAALARTILIAGKMEGDERWALTREANKLGGDDGGVSYQLEPIQVAEGVSAVRVAWEAQLAGTSREILLNIEAGPSKRKTREKAILFLRERLEVGPASVKELTAEARIAGFTAPTLRRAREDLGVQAQKSGMKEGWLWVLPTPNCHQSKSSN